jgi:hypothetical protein
MFFRENRQSRQNTTICRTDTATYRRRAFTRSNHRLQRKTSISSSCHRRPRFNTDPRPHTTHLDYKQDQMEKKHTTVRSTHRSNKRCTEAQNATRVPSIYSRRSRSMERSQCQHTNVHTVPSICHSQRNRLVSKQDGCVLIQPPR